MSTTERQAAPTMKPCKTCKGDREICSACRKRLLLCRCNPNAYDAEDLPPGMECPDCAKKESA